LKPRRGVLGIAVGALLAGTLAPAAAEAKPPEITQPPVIAGTPQVGATLVAERAVWNPRDIGTTVTWQWLRCDDAGPETCLEISGATATDYTVVSADLDKHLRVLMSVRNDEGEDEALTGPTAVVTSPSPPAPDPEPSPSPEPSPQPSVEPVVQTAPAAQTPAPAAGSVLDQQARSLRMMDPAPVVRIRGRLTRSGARITLLTVRAPRGARITVRCIGRGCPARRWAGIATLTRIARFEGSFRAGDRLVVTVAKRGRIGKHTTITFRRGAAPKLRDRCLMPGARRPIRCPAA
jgi:hypothetical protein